MPLRDRASLPHLPAAEAPARAHDFHLAVEQDAETLLLKLSGDFDLVGVGRLEATADRAVRLSTRHVVFDLADVTFLDMAGLVSLMRMDERSRRTAFDVQILAPRGLARRVFTLTRAGEQLTMITVAPTVGPNRA